MTLKTCQQCSRTMDEEAFPLCPDKRGYNYRRGTCKRCINDRNKARRAGAIYLVRLTTEKPRPCDSCYRLNKCANDHFICAAFSQWTDYGQYIPAHIGMVDSQQRTA